MDLEDLNFTNFKGLRFFFGHFFQFIQVATSIPNSRVGRERTKTKRPQQTGVRRRQL